MAINGVNVYRLYMTRMVQLSEVAYDLLRRAKRPDESFSDVVCRILPKPKPLRLAGLSTKKELEEADRLRRIADEAEEERSAARLRKRGLIP